MGNIKFRKFKLDKIKLSFYHKSEVKISKGGSRIDTNKISGNISY